MYLTTGSLVYDPTTGRSLVDRGGTRGFIMFGNSPTNTEKGIDWSLYGGPNPTGETWLDAYVINPVAGLGTGFADAVTFGRAGKWQRSLYGDAIADMNQSGPAYYIGMAAGIASTIYVGFGAAGAAGNLGHGLRAYNVVGDVVGVADSINSYRENGHIGAMDALGFLPTVGWAARGAGAVGRGVKMAGRSGVMMAGHLSRGSTWASRALDCNAASSLDGAATRAVRKLLGECFVAGTPVVTGVISDPLYAVREADDEDGSWSGAWVVCGIASLAAAHVLAGGRPLWQRHRPWHSARRSHAHLPTVVHDPDWSRFDASGVDFQSVCDELLLGWLND